MYFSVIVPTYNPRKYLAKFLDSIIKNECRNNIEVILIDDVSTEDFTDIVDEYKGSLNISVGKNEDHYGAPVIGRQSGANISTGKWICFADQDDWFTDNAFDEVKSFIERENAKNYIVTDFIMRDDDGNETLIEKAQNWTHGKFYEKTFWNDANIEYENIKYCEDIALSVRVNCVLAEGNMERYYFNHPTYVWYQHEDSLSNASRFTEKGYFFKSFPDYIKSTLGVYIARYEVATLNEELDFYYRFNIASMMMYLFFYFKGMERKENFCPKIPKEYYSLAYGYFVRYLKKAGYKNYKEFLVDMRKEQEFIDEYTRARGICVKQIPFIENESFDEWLKKLKWRAKGGK